jgi:hypothetical protein
MLAGATARPGRCAGLRCLWTRLRFRFVIALLSSLTGTTFAPIISPPVLLPPGVLEQIVPARERDDDGRDPRQQSVQLGFSPHTHPFLVDSSLRSE